MKSIGWGIWLVAVLVTAGYWVDWLWFWIIANILCVVVMLHWVDIKSLNAFHAGLGYVYTLSFIVIKADKAGRDHVWDLMRSMGVL